MSLSQKALESMLAAQQREAAAGTNIKPAPVEPQPIDLTIEQFDAEAARIAKEEGASAAYGYAISIFNKHAPAESDALRIHAGLKVVEFARAAHVSGAPDMAKRLFAQVDSMHIMPGNILRYPNGGEVNAQTVRRQMSILACQLRPAEPAPVPAA